jgi:hypothetical protein
MPVATMLGGILWYNYHSAPCASPIVYTIGSIDPRFNISKTDIEKAMHSAELIWEKPAGKPLFEVGKKGTLVINFIYDERQKNTEKRQVLVADSQKVKLLAKDTKDQYFELDHELQDKKQAYEVDLASYKSQQLDYNATVEMWNKKGGAPKEIYDQLHDTRQTLDAAFQDLDLRRQEINNLIETINAFSKKYNLLVDSINQNIDEINKTAGKEFQEGTYNPNDNSITIYEFDSQNALTRVLAHELGHALTLDHNENPDSIMYEVNKSSTLTASPDDIMALKLACKL